jgi:hypothetical protein
LANGQKEHPMQFNATQTTAPLYTASPYRLRELAQEQLIQPDKMRFENFLF